jgi:acyl-CoA thioesterase I
MQPSRIRRSVAIAVLIAGCGSSKPHAAATAPPQRDGTRLVVVGDSLAFGRFADTQADAFPQRVADSLDARLELLAAPGVTTAQLAAQAAPAGGDAVVVEAGTNDVLYQTPRRRFAADYRTLIAKVKAASPGAKLVCVTTWIPSTGMPQARIPSSFYDATIRRECDGGSVADVSRLPMRLGMRGPEGRPTYLGPGDGFHPNSAGHAAIARLIESEL